jgi:two-component system LytT family sensor kinase
MSGAARNDSHSTTPRPARFGDRLLWSVVATSGVITILTVVGSRFVQPERPPRGVGRMYPRVPGGPANTGDLLRVLGIGSLTWYVCVLSAPLFIWLSRRFPIDGRRWPARLTIHLLVVLVLVFATAGVQHRLTYAGAPIAPPISTYLVLALLTGSLPFLAVAAAAHALEARTRAHERELEAARARSQLAEARLEALTAQLQPHFLFNTLQGISTLITHDPDGADRMLNSLSDLLREVLRRSETREVELTEEVRVLGPYLEISRWRFGQRLTVTIDVAHDAQGALVPFFILQPLVENAVHHGVGSRAGVGTIAIRAWRDDTWLRLTVTDDGAGINGSAPSTHGIGLANTRARLRELYGDRQALELASVDPSGSRASIAIPYHVRTPSAAESRTPHQTAE